jgi:hypothetical protein
MESKKTTESASDLPVYDSIDQCSAATGIPRGAIKLAKRKGCKAFKSNRIYLCDLLPWLFSNDGAAVPWSDVFQEWRAKREKLRHDKDAGILINEEDSAEWFLRFAKEAAGIYHQKLINEMPSAVAGLDVPSARIYGKRIYNLTMAALRQIVKKPEMKKLLEKHESDIASL